MVELRFAVLSDIHGNLWALTAVLEDAGRRGIDRFVNLGDVLYSPLKPLETYQLLNTIDAITIQGNQDRDIYEADHARIAYNPTLAYVVAELGDEPIEWLRSLPKTATVDEDVFACHGTPDSDLVYLLDDVSDGFSRVRDEREIVSLLGRIDSPLILCGHTHIARVVRLSSGQLVVNPGSVGLPAYDDEAPNYHRMQNYSPLASYAIIENRQGDWLVEHLKVPYDFHSAAEKARRQGREDWACWIESGRAA